jgi:ATP-dependent Clp protease ATP-binding subunit ClpX
MYDIPSRGDVRKCVVSAETITNRQRPLLVTRSGQPVDDDGEKDLEEAAAS